MVIDDDGFDGFDQVSWLVRCVIVRLVTIDN